MLQELRDKILGYDKSSNNLFCKYISNIISRTPTDNPVYGYAYNLFLNTVKTAGGIMFGCIFCGFEKNCSCSVKAIYNYDGDRLDSSVWCKFLITHYNDYISSVGCFIDYFYDSRGILHCDWFGFGRALHNNRFFLT